MSELDTTSLRAAAELLENALAEPGLELPEGDLRRLFAAAVRLFVARLERGGKSEGVSPFPPEDEGAPSTTEVMIAASEFLAAAEVELFELGMWQTWGGIGTVPSTDQRSGARG